MLGQQNPALTALSPLASLRDLNFLSENIFFVLTLI